MESFHNRHRAFIIFAMLGGFYFSSFKKLIHNSWGIFGLKVYSAFAWLLLLTIVISTIFHIFNGATTVFDALIDIESLFTNSLASVRSLFLYFNMKLLMKTIETWDDFFLFDQDAAQRAEYMAETSKIVMKTVPRFSILTYLVLPGWTFAQFFNAEKYMELPVGYDYKHKSPDYEIVVGLHFAIYSYYSFILGCVDTIVFLPLSWITAELRRLRHSLSAIISGIDWKDGLEEHERNRQISIMDKKLKLWIVQHQKLCRFHSIFQKIYSICLSIEQMAIVVIAFCVSCVVALKLVGVVNSSFQVVYFSRYFAIFYAACSWGDDIQKESLAVFDDVFDKNWTVLPRSIRSNLKIISMRVRKPLVFHGYKLFILGSPTFLQVMRTSYTIINFLRATLGKKV